MAHLETLHRFRHRLVEGAGRLVGGEVAADDQAIAQDIVIGTGGTGGQPEGGYDYGRLFVPGCL
jgi:hypothetical protein